MYTARNIPCLSTDPSVESVERQTNAERGDVNVTLGLFSVVRRCVCDDGEDAAPGLSVCNAWSWEKVEGVVLMLLIHQYGCCYLVVPCRGGSELLGLNPLELLHRQAALVELVEFLFTALLLLLVLRSSLQHGGDVVGKSQLL